MMTKQIKFIIAIAIQLAIIFGIIIFKVTILTGGQDIILRIAPVDPRDPLRGDYVTFTYQDISNIYSSYFGYNDIRNGDKIYVTLWENQGYYNAESVYKDKPKEGIFIKGTVVSGGEDIFSDKKNPFQRLPNSSKKIGIKYGIEEYFIKEGSGRNMSFTGNKNYALIKVNDEGNAVIKQLYVNENPWP